MQTHPQKTENYLNSCDTHPFEIPPKKCHLLAYQPFRVKDIKCINWILESLISKNSSFLYLDLKGDDVLHRIGTQNKLKK